MNLRSIAHKVPEESLKRTYRVFITWVHKSKVLFYGECLKLIYYLVFALPKDVRIYIFLYLLLKYKGLLVRPLLEGILRTIYLFIFISNLKSMQSYNIHEY